MLVMANGNNSKNVAVDAATATAAAAAGDEDDANGGEIMCCVGDAYRGDTYIYTYVCVFVQLLKYFKIPQ